MGKINIAELLKDCPKGMELYSPIFGKVYLDKIRPHLAIVVTIDKEHGDFKEEFLYDGRYGMNGECMLFPSKDKTTWEGFQRSFKDGDIVMSSLDSIHILKNSTTSYCYLDRIGLLDKSETTCVRAIRFATEEEKQKLFDAIKAKGYKWNAETKTLEKLSKFKVGVKIRSKANPDIILSIISDDCHGDEFECSNGSVLSLKQIEKFYDIII